MLWFSLLAGCAQPIAETGGPMLAPSLPAAEETAPEWHSLLPRATTWVGIEILLSTQADPEPALAGYADGGLDGTVAAASVESLRASADYWLAVPVFDERGTIHELTLCFDRVWIAEWAWTLVADGADVALGPGPGEPGHALEVQYGVLTFDTDGLVAAETSGAAATAWSWLACPAFPVDLELDARMADGPSRGLVVDADGRPDLWGVRGRL